MHKSRIGKISKLITFRATFQSTSPLLNYSNCPRFVVLRPTFGTTRATDLNILTVSLFFSVVLIGTFGNKVRTIPKPASITFVCGTDVSEILTVQLVRLITQPKRTHNVNFTSININFWQNNQVKNLNGYTSFSINFKMIYGLINHQFYLHFKSALICKNFRSDNGQLDG